MKLMPIVAALRARCPRFENRVDGVAQFQEIPQPDELKLPVAYVVPAADVIGRQRSRTDYWQTLTEGFSVIVVLSDAFDEQGKEDAYDVVHDVRHELWQALLGWCPDPNAHEIQYAGGRVLPFNGDELYYQFDFTMRYEIEEADTCQQIDLDALDELKTLSIDVDSVDPGAGPDGKSEQHINIVFP